MKQNYLRLPSNMYLDVETISLLIDSIFKYKNQEEIIVDLSHVKFIDSCYIPILKALKNLVNIKFKKSSKREVNDYILEQDGLKSARDTVYPITISRKKQHISEQTKYLIEYLNRYLTDEETSKYIAFILQELVSNIFDHSGSLIGAIINGQTYPNRTLGTIAGYVQLTVLDLGVGFKETLSRKYNVEDEIEAIKLATEKNITGAFQSNPYGIPKNVGFGLYAIKEFVKYLRGRMIIISNNGLVQFVGQEEPKIDIYQRKLKYGWKGTIVIIELPMDTLNYYEFDVLMDLIRGEELETSDFEDLFE